MEKAGSSAPGQVRWLEVAAGEAGQRVDNYLMRQLKGVPRSLIYRILRRGEVRVNRGRVRPTYRVQTGDQVRIPPLRVAAGRETPRVAAALGARLAGRVLYEDDRLLVLDKPAGMAVHGGSGIGAGVIEALRALRPHAPFLELVHRLDRATSGCLLVAKDRDSLRSLHARLRAGELGKAYLALLRGPCHRVRPAVTAALERNRLRGGERLAQVDPAGKAARTLFKPLTDYRWCCLVEARPLTGRTHQIRVHAAHMGMPLAGDDRYGDRAFNERLRPLGLRRLFLHAHRVSIPDWHQGDSLELSAPLAEELRAVLVRLEETEGTRA